MTDISTSTLVVRKSAAHQPVLVKFSLSRFLNRSRRVSQCSEFTGALSQLTCRFLTPSGMKWTPMCPSNSPEHTPDGGNYQFINIYKMEMGIAVMLEHLFACWVRGSCLPHVFLTHFLLPKHQQTPGFHLQLITNFSRACCFYELHSSRPLN